MNRRMRRALVVLGIAVAVAGAALAGGMPGIDPTIVGTWRWTDAEIPLVSLEPPGGQDYIITFRADGTLTMDFEGNEYGGTFTADSGSISIVPEEPDAPTWVPGSPGPRLVELVSDSRGYRVRRGELRLETLGGNGSLNFEPVN